MDQHTIVILNLTQPSMLTGEKEAHITCSCGLANLFVNQSFVLYEAETHAKSHTPTGIIEEF